ncbi:MAG: hypothetical protein CVV06_08430 [Gammaproteobacteria bacterium HGW-Gammaproteobacteria-10]|nr:MAG: hypothetical protein CVV06_08430 [Gammaproteobacteria bacterium HGW-Gammaproteobacteria-10]
MPEEAPGCASPHLTLGEGTAWSWHRAQNPKLLLTGYEKPGLLVLRSQAKSLGTSDRPYFSPLTADC